ncbi:hypothetical protein QWJ34_02435 [Saccharibacillus sp. CPCC 101409]|uniref:hypothetical protein n=1 Tax=Saccharibacillus sp. CPCC 101409 TaxID=3058041 RepID=UPI002671D330|nr:hypothetical protein [Saccharibacillus sp. CPCC 101409]MDO3408621.1 hypothetical protein [Saccharibacillus sp. CPCC 101409]
MAKSAARKARDKQVREGRLDAAVSRSPFAFADMRTRKTKTRQDKLNRIKHKNPNLTGGDQGSYLFVKSLTKRVDEKVLAC